MFSGADTCFPFHFITTTKTLGEEAFVYLHHRQGYKAVTMYDFRWQADIYNQKRHVCNRAASESGDVQQVVLRVGIT